MHVDKMRRKGFDRDVNFKLENFIVEEVSIDNIPIQQF